MQQCRRRRKSIRTFRRRFLFVGRPYAFRRAWKIRRKGFDFLCASISLTLVAVGHLFVCCRQTIVCCRQTIVCSHQTIVCCRQTMHKAVGRPQIRVALADDPMVIGRASVEVDLTAKGCLGAQTKNSAKPPLRGSLALLPSKKLNQRVAAAASMPIRYQSKRRSMPSSISI